MSWFEVYKIIASIILSICIFFLIGYIGNKLVNPKIPKDQAYLIEIPESPKIKNNASLINDETISLEPVSNIMASASLENGEKISKKCSSCHNFKNGEPDKIGPNLFEIVGAPIARATGFAYSKAMANFGGNWDYEELSNFLYKPKKYIEGTKMNFAGLKKISDRADLIMWLRLNAENPIPLP